MTAAALLYTSLGLGLLCEFWEWPAERPLGLLVYFIVVMVLAVFVLFIYLIGRRVS